MSANPLDVALGWTWDGETPTAILRINGREIAGTPLDVESAFGALYELKKRADHLENRVLSAIKAFGRVEDALWGTPPARPATPGEERET